MKTVPCQKCLVIKPCQEYSTRDLLKVGYGVQRGWLCKECVPDKNWHPCSACNCNITLDVAYTGGVCADCTFFYGDRREFDALEHFYNNNGPVPMIQATASTDLYFGVEFEVEAALHIGHVFKELFPIIGDRAIFKTDGSLRNGFEICSTGMTFDQHTVYRGWHNLFKHKATGKLHPLNTRAGMHVHFSANAVPFEKANNIFNFFKDRDNRQFIEIIAERNGNDYCEYPRERTDFRGHGGSHYSAINYAHRGTYEIRIFQTVVQKENFFKNLEFVKAMIDLALVGPFNFHDVTVHVKNNKDMFPNLFNFMRHAGMFKARGRRVTGMFKHKASNFRIAKMTKNKKHANKLILEKVA